MSEEAERMEALGVAGIDRKNLAIEPLGLGKSTVTVIAERHIEEVSGRTVSAGSRTRADVPVPLARGTTLSSVHEWSA
jgi:hypothetical protein